MPVSANVERSSEIFDGEVSALDVAKFIPNHHRYVVTTQFVVAEITMFSWIIRDDPSSAVWITLFPYIYI